MLLIVADVLALYLVMTVGLPAVERWLAARPGTARFAPLTGALAFGELGLLAAWCERAAAASGDPAPTIAGGDEFQVEPDGTTGWQSEAAGVARCVSWAAVRTHDTGTAPDDGAARRRFADEPR